MRCVALFIAAFLLAPATASAQRVEDTFFNSVIPSRVDHLIGFTPTTFAIHPLGQRVVPITVRVGGRRHRYIFGNAAAVVGPSANIYMRNMIRGRRFPSPQGIFLDRRLKAAERRHVQVRADLGRDADVLAVGREHPACVSGVSRAAARGIAAGTIRTWSAAGVPTPSGGNAIALRRAGSGVDRFVEPRFRAGGRLPQGARAAFDGGLSEAASGNLAIAAVTSWSRARAYQATTCAVPFTRHGLLPPARDAPGQGGVAGGARSAGRPIRPLMRRLPVGVALVIALAALATAGAAPPTGTAHVVR